MEDAQDKDAGLLGIKAVSQKTGLPASTIRYYDQQFEDYLQVKRGAGRRRLFSAQAVERLLNLHRMLKEEGLSLRQVRQALSGQAPAPLAAAPAGGWEPEVAKLKEEVEAMKKQLGDLKEIQRRTLALVDTITGS